ncbi:glycosyltransferase family 2 protein [Haloprofundus salilacus]|uniref:glycosyltransferase family 2 protein n=1 Tax=Haloprofundus salilacus TaxID=2876190 RepID=UPI001CCA0B2A|nr:glycosyltransferase [Haloprofundus salilacus]
MFGRDKKPLVSYVIVTYNRADDLESAVESVLAQKYRPLELVVVSNSTDVVPEQELFGDGGRFDEQNIHYHHIPERMGVPGARNAGFDYADGDIVITLDDDAIIADAAATDVAVSLFDEHDDVGAIAFQCRNYHTRAVKSNETPNPPRFDLTPLSQYRATNFVGVGNAIRRSVLETVGGYPEDFVYGFEEMDLSLRIHDTGYDILYTPSVVVYHKKSPAARISDTETQERMVENRMKVAIRNLPGRYVVCSFLIWSVYAVWLTGQISSLWNIYRRLYERRTDLRDHRRVVSSQTIARIKSRNTMLFAWWYGPHPMRIFGPNGELERLTWER